MSPKTIIRALGNWGTKVDPFGVVTPHTRGHFLGIP